MKTCIVLFISCLVGFVIAECPNGCSGAGVCSARDMCTCDKNFEGNDCSLRTCPHAYAHIDSPKGDLNMDGSTKSSWELTNSQQYPAGGTEFINPDAANDEAHFYMECANKGTCDREAGACVCFEGYTGHACQRTVCPNDCSGHGTCESISELASNRGGSLFFKPTYHGDQTYVLWDQKSSYGCKCDPWYYGADCSLRRCKVGVDPMYEAAGVEIVETFLIRLGYATGNFGSGNSMRLRYFDYWGESYITSLIPIVVENAVTVAASVEAALLALPNGVITDISCGDSTENPLIWAVSVDSMGADTGILIGCKAVSNPGAHRLPEFISLTFSTAIVTKITGSTQRGEDVDLCGTLDSAPLTGLAKGDVAATITGDSDIGTIATDTAYLMKVNDQLIAVSAKVTNSLTLVYAWPAATITSSTSVYYSTTPLSKEDQDVSTAAIGGSALTMAAEPTNIQAGFTVFFENQIFEVVSVSTVTINLDRPFAGASSNGAAVTNVGIYYYANKPTTATFTYVSECSGRGLCNTESGVCQCFKGYTSDNCDTQNILAF